MRGAKLVRRTPAFLGRERAAVGVDVDPARRSPRYHGTCLALESVEESGAAVLEPRSVWLRRENFVLYERKVGFIENTAMRHRRGG